MSFLFKAILFLVNFSSLECNAICCYWFNDQFHYEVGKQKIHKEKSILEYLHSEWRDSEVSQVSVSVCQLFSADGLPDTAVKGRE